MLFVCLVSDAAFGKKIGQLNLRSKSCRKLVGDCINSEKHARVCNDGWGTLQSYWGIDRYADGVLELTLEGPRHSLAVNCPGIMLELCHDAWIRGDWICYESWRNDVSPCATDLAPHPPLDSENGERHPKSGKYRRRDRKRRLEQAIFAIMVDSLGECEVSLEFCLSLIPCVRGVTAFRDQHFPGRDSVTLKELMSVRALGFAGEIKRIGSKFVDYSLMGGSVK